MNTASVVDAILARRSVRAFTGRGLPDVDVEELLKAAQLAPSSLNAQPWRFKVVRGPADLTWLCGGVSRNQGLFAKAGGVFVCCVDPDAYLADSAAAAEQYAASGMLPPETAAGIEAYVRAEQALPRNELVRVCAVSLALAVAQMSLLAVEMGLGSCWVGMFDEAAVKARFSIPPHMSVICMLVVGEPADAPASSGSRPRKTLAEITL